MIADPVASQTGVVIADATRPGFPLIYVSPGFEELTGHSAEQLLGRSCRVLQGPGSDPTAVDMLRRALASGDEANVRVLNYRADGSSFWNEVSLAPERDSDGVLRRYIGVQKDVSERVQVDAKVHELAYFDSLTGLVNRGSMHTQLETALATARERETELALLFVDIDDFKHVNDTYGHLVGDALLRHVADRLGATVRDEDVLARAGGDEFLLLLAAEDDVQTRAGELADRLIRSLRNPLSVNGHPPVDIRASIGVSTFPHDASSAEELLRHADAAMYRAKDSGKNGFRAFAIDRSSAPWERQSIDGTEQELDRILVRRLVSTVFQPIIELETQQVIGHEALARGPAGSMLQRPDRLFAAAAAFGRTDELDWLCRATAITEALGAGLGRGTTLFLNCEPTAIASPCPAEHRAAWARAVDELDLVLEITERAVLDRPAELALEVQDHRQAGRRVALDDIGADVRSLALLPLIEPDIIKLDLRLVQDRPSTEQAAIISAVAAESERTGAAVLAEGIENDDHAEIALTLGATLGQGWLWGRPGALPECVSVTEQKRVRPRRHRSRPAQRQATPFTVVTERRPTAIGSKGRLLPMSHHLENRAMSIGEGAVILAGFQDARHFTKDTRRRYATLARGASLVAALGADLEDLVPGVRGSKLERDDPLVGEWSVLVIGPHFAGAIVARDLGDRGREFDRRFEFATTYDRRLVIAAARTLLTRISPSQPTAA